LTSKGRSQLLLSRAMENCPLKWFKSFERAKLLDGLEGWLSKRFIRHRGNADVVRQDL
jgi:hypothetical protein